MKNIIMVFILSLYGYIGFAQDAAFKKDIVRFNEITGFTAKIEAVKTGVLESLSDEGKKRFSEEFDTAFTTFKEKSAALFAQYYTHDDFKSTIKLFEETNEISLPEIVKGEEFSKAYQKLNEEFSVAVQKAYLKEQ